MKLSSLINAALLSAGLLTAASAEDAVKFNVPGVSAPASQPAAPAKAPTTAAPAPAAPVKFTDAQLLEVFGYIYVLNSGFAGQMEAMEFTPAHREAILRGMALGMENKNLPYDQQQSQQIETQLKEFMKTRQDAYLAKRDAYLTKLRMQNLNDNLAYFSKLKDNKNIIELPSGLRYEILKPATGAVAKPGQLATIHYTLSLINGQAMGSTIGGQPIDLPLVIATGENPNGTIAGMVEALQKIGVGGKARLYIPPSLAYGDDGYQGIPPGATLIFEIEVVGVKDAPKEAAAPAAK